KSVSSLSRDIFVVTENGVIESLKKDEICSDRHSEHFQAEFQGECFDDHAAARNKLIDQLESNREIDWLLWFNSGEVFDATTFDELVSFFEKDADRDALHVMILNRFAKEGGCKRHELDEETIDARLMPMRKGLRFQGRVRESLFPFASRLLLSVKAASGRILCPSRFEESEDRKELARQTLSMLQRLEQQGEKIIDESLALRADMNIVLGNFLSARTDLLQLVDQTTKPNLRLEGYYTLWETMTFAPLPADQMTKVLVAGVDHFPVDMQMLTFLGDHLQRTGRGDLARRTFELAVCHGQVSLDVWHRIHIREIAVKSFALVYHLHGNNKEAIRVLETNRDIFPGSIEYARFLLDLYIIELHEERAWELAGEVWSDSQLDLIRNVIVGACHATTGNWKEAMPSLETAYKSGCEDILALRWYSQALLSQGRHLEAIPVLEKWIAIEPNNSGAKRFLMAAKQPSRVGSLMEELQKSCRHSDTQTVETQKGQMNRALKEMVVTSGHIPEGSNEICAAGSNVSKTLVIK
ncbi:MAG: tetratricopeptide repeat-containing glycosyltransferase, partial [Thermoguttaceae bacterium]